MVKLTTGVKRAYWIFGILTVIGLSLLIVSLLVKSEVMFYIGLGILLVSLFGLLITRMTKDENDTKANEKKETQKREAENRALDTEHGPSNFRIYINGRFFRYIRRALRFDKEKLIFINNEGVEESLNFPVNIQFRDIDNREVSFKSLVKS